MCGFFGVFTPGGTGANVRHRVETSGVLQRHRGPDDSGAYHGNEFSVVFYRLSIIDLSSAGRQPMRCPQTGVVLVFNGEIYNYRELRQELVGRGCVFRSASDTEVVLNAYLEYGLKCVEKLRGMFACAVYDPREGSLHLLRDRVGIKPLFVCEHEGGWLVSTEVKSILDYAPEIIVENPEAVFRFLARGWADDGNDTFFRDIDKVAPGSVMTLSGHGVHSQVYWRLSAGNGEAYSRSEFLECFTQTVKSHLRADVPVAMTLSGGMDSSAIAGVAASIVPPDNLSALSVIPPHTVDESGYIDDIVEHTHIGHQYLDLDFSNMTESLDATLRVHDEPFQSSSCVYQFLLRQAVARMGVKVLLVGEGGDEVLGGYGRLIYPFLFSLAEDGRDKEFAAAVSGACRFLGYDEATVRSRFANYRKLVDSGGSGQENLAAYSVLSPDYSAHYQSIVDSKAYPADDFGMGNRFFAHLKEHILTRDIPYVLRMEDRNSMAFGVESRVPFLDHVFLEYVFTRDYGEFMKGGSNKAMSRKAMRSILPDSVVDRCDKSPRPGNNGHFIYEVALAPMREMLLDKTALPHEFFVSDIADRFADDVKAAHPARAEFWFRLYVYLRWKGLFFGQAGRNHA